MPAPGWPSRSSKNNDRPVAPRVAYACRPSVPKHIQDKERRAQDIRGRRLEGEVREHEAAVKTHVEKIATLYLELVHLGDNRAGLAEKIRVMREIDQLATGYVTRYAKSLLLLLKDESDLLFLRLPQFGIGAERAIAALVRRVPQLRPADRPDRLAGLPRR